MMFYYSLDVNTKEMIISDAELRNFFHRDIGKDITVSINLGCIDYDDADNESETDFAKSLRDIGSNYHISSLCLLSTRQESIGLLFRVIPLIVKSLSGEKGYPVKLILLSLSDCTFNFLPEVPSCIKDVYINAGIRDVDWLPRPDRSTLTLIGHTHTAIKLSYGNSVLDLLLSTNNYGGAFTFTLKYAESILSDRHTINRIKLLGCYGDNFIDDKAVSDILLKNVDFLEDKSNFLYISVAISGEPRWESLSRLKETLRKLKIKGTVLGLGEEFFDLVEEIKKEQKEQDDPLKKEKNERSIELYRKTEALDFYIKTSSCKESADSRRKSYAEKMQNGNAARCFSTLPLEINQKLEELKAFFPNFASVVDYIQPFIEMAKITGLVYFPPILLNGKPGIGKTKFSKSLAEILGTEYHFLSMETAETDSMLTGSEEYWGNSNQGLVFRSLVDGKYCNPILLLDEIDKINRNDKYNPENALYQLLERDTAKKFKDKGFSRVEIDASNIIWIATSNSWEKLPEPILSRLTLLDIPELTLDQSKIVVRSIFDEIKLEYDMGERISLTEGSVDCLVEYSPREMKKLLLQAIGKALACGRSSIEAFDIQQPRKTMAIGFCPN